MSSKQYIKSVCILFFGVILFALNSQATQAQSGNIDWNGWTFGYEIGTQDDGLAITNVKFQGKEIMSRGNFPAMPVYYNNNSCGPYLDRLDGDLVSVPWANNATVVSRQFTTNGQQWYELGIREFIGQYDIYQVWYFSANGIIDAHLFSRGLQCNVYHEHWPQWRFDFDIAGSSNDQILRQTTGGLQAYQTEFNVTANQAQNHGWVVQDTVTGDYVELDFDSGVWSPSGTVEPQTSYAKNRVAGRRYNSGEEDWHTTGHSSLPSNWNDGAGRIGYGNGENINNTDLVLWYSGYLPHSASEGSSLWHSTGVRITVHDGGLSLVDPGDQSGYVNEGTSLSLESSIPSGQTGTFSATGLPPGLGINATNGSISGTPTTAGTYNVTVTLSDNQGDSVDTSFTWTIDTRPDNDGDGTPDLTDIDDDNDGIPDEQEQGATSTPFDIRITALSVPGDGQSSTNTVDLSAYGVQIGDSVNVYDLTANGDLNSSSEYFSLNFNDGEFSTGNVHTGIQCSSSYNSVTASLNANVTVIDIGGGTPGLKIRGTTTTAVDYSPCFDVSYRLRIAGNSSAANDTDTDGDSIIDRFDLDSDNDGLMDVAEAGGADANGDGLIDNASSNQGTLTNPTNSDNDSQPDYQDLESADSTNDGNGPFDIANSGFANFDTNNDGTINSDDAQGGTDNDNDGIDDAIDGAPNSPGTAPINSDPTVTNPGDQSNTIGDTVSLTIAASDPDAGNVLTFGAANLPTDLSLNSTTGQITGNPTAVGVSTVAITVNDGNGGSDSISFTWTIVAPPNQNPTITSPGDQTTVVDDSVNLVVIATDPDAGDTLTFSETNLPTGLNLNTATGEITGNPTTIGESTVTVTANDGNSGTDSVTFIWAVIVPPILLGDVNCDDAVTSADALAILQHAVGLRTAQNSCPLADPVTMLNTSVGDVSGDSQVDSADALLILQCDSGSTNVFCP